VVPKSEVSGRLNRSIIMASCLGFVQPTGSRLAVKYSSKPVHDFSFRDVAVDVVVRSLRGLGRPSGGSSAALRSLSFGVLWPGNSP
jgi:hypothetical protein